jgi:SAM-dependent methyltransferase
MARDSAALPKDMRDAWAKTYQETPYRELPWFSPRPYPWVRQAVNAGWFRRGSRVLDVGCGAGTNAMFLSESGFRAAGIDVAPKAIEAARRRAERLGLTADFQVADALRLPFAKGYFGGLIDVGCFHTLPTRLRGAYSRELARVLRPGGRYALSWVAREHAEMLGPPHRPSVEETAAAFEHDFQFLRTEYHNGSRWAIPAYSALLERRSTPQPKPR